MVEHPSYEFRNTELDPGLLTTPFGAQTNWHVITGASSCGKTTLINLLSDKGFQTVPEGAREFMEGEIARRRTIDEIHANAVDLQENIQAIQLRIERGLQATEITFLDGAVPGSLAWRRVFGLDPNDFLPDCSHHRYASVFIFDPLPLQLDGLRFDESELIDFLDAWIARDYNTLGYEVVRVPVMTPEERFAFVLENLSKRRLIS